MERLDPLKTGRLLVGNQELQLMAVGIVEVDAMRIALAAADFDAGVLQCRFDPFIFPRIESQRHMIDLAAAMHFFAVIDFKECDALAAAFEEALPIPLVLDFQSEKIDVEFSRAREIFDVKDT